MPETTPLIKAALNLRVGVGFDVYGKVMGRKSRYSEYAKGMKKKADAKNAATKSHNKSIKDRLKNLKEESKKESKKGVK